MINETGSQVGVFVPSPIALRHGFTLIELVMVLVILAILATAALNFVEVEVDQTRFETTQRTIDNVNRAIFEEKRTADGRSYLSGFTVDMGRPPKTLVDPENANILTLGELWLPSGLPAFQARPATEDNVTTFTDSNGDTVAADQDVTVLAGWRGPYLQLPIGATELTDGWGHRLVSFTNSVDDATYSHLRGDDDMEILTPNASIFGIRSLGRDDTTVEATGYDIDVPATTSGISLSGTALKGTIQGTVHVNSGLSATTGNVVVQVYFPDPMDAAEISVERASGAELTLRAPQLPPSGYDSFDFIFDDGSGGQVDFPVGPRVIRAYLDSGSDMSGDFNDGSVSDPPNQTLPKIVSIVPSTNGIELTINP